MATKGEFLWCDFEPELFQLPKKMEGQVEAEHEEDVVAADAKVGHSEPTELESNDEDDMELAGFSIAAIYRKIRKRKRLR